MAVIIYWHNPRCSKSRQGLALLEERGATLELRRYLDAAPSEQELRDLLTRLNLAPVEMMRTREARFRALGLTRQSDDATLIAAMAADPILIERPIGIAGDRAVIGRPPERLLDLLD